MLCLADRAFVGFALWRTATATGADLLWRVRANQVLPCRQRLPDGSYISCLYASPKHRRHDEDGLVVRVIDYCLDGVPDAEPPGSPACRRLVRGGPLHRLVTTRREPDTAPAAALAALYHERWESEGAFAELKVTLPGRRLLLRSRRAGLALRELYGLLLVHLALPAESSRGRHSPRVVKRKMSDFPTKARAAPASSAPRRYARHIRIVAPPARRRSPGSPCRRRARSPHRGDAAKPPRTAAAGSSGTSTSATGGPATCREPPIAATTVWTCAPSTNGWRGYAIAFGITQKTIGNGLKSTVLPLGPLHASSSIRSGASMHSLIRTRNETASRPSTMRWS
jgi:hypothetical protein